MSLTVGRNLLQRCTGLLSSSRSISRSVSGVYRSSLLSRPQQVQGSLARTMWSLCSRQPTGLAALEARLPTSGARWTKTCGCCGLHTQGDADLLEFLGEEIEHERSTAVSPSRMPEIRGFKINCHGSEIVLTKEADGEKISIEMNINHSVEDAGGAEQDQQNQDSAAEMVSHPPFTVKINKGGDLTLAIQCEFPEQEAYQPPAEGQEDYEDAIEITEVAMLRGEWEEKVYSVSGSVMDGNLYDMLMNMMEERGVTGECVDKIVDYATAYDQQKYITFLEDLQSFANSK